jgi:hypothetical protein
VDGKEVAGQSLASQRNCLVQIGELACKIELQGEVTEKNRYINPNIF